MSKRRGPCCIHIIVVGACALSVKSEEAAEIAMSWKSGFDERKVLPIS